MEILYRIFTWISIGTINLILGGIVYFLFSLLNLPPGIHILLFFLFYAFLLWRGWKKSLCKDKLIEPCKKTRLPTLLFWITVLTVLYTGWNWLSFEFGAPNYIAGINTDYILISILVLTAGAMCVFKPFLLHKNSLEISVKGCIAALFLFIFMVFIPSETNYDYHGKKLPVGYKMPTSMQERFFPDGAFHFEITGKSMLFANHAEWSCNVSEKDFETFRKKHGYHFVLNRTDVNEDKNVGPLNYSDQDWKKPYYFYNNRHANGGGLTMRYSVPEQKLYGRYCNR